MAPPSLRLELGSLIKVVARYRIHAICTEQLSKGKRSAHQVLKLIDTLIKLIPWLNGKIPVKEIAFQSAISEAEITRVLSTFYELMTVEYEPDIATMS
ncbi:hypothetical protein AAVH_28883 [Aphelenchoides avenae]|nr:hypothetical protein AAVH_28883 [Aphelenchus avenae]